MGPCFPVMSALCVVSRRQLVRKVSLEQVTERRQHNGGAASAARNARERPVDLDQVWKPDRLKERTTVIGGIAAWSRWRGAELDRRSILIGEVGGACMEYWCSQVR